MDYLIEKLYMQRCFLLLLLLTGLTSYSQVSFDSELQNNPKANGFVIADLLNSPEWQKQEIVTGLNWYSRDFDSLNGCQEFVNVLQVDTRTIKLNVVYDEKHLKTVKSRANSIHGLAAVNGNFFNPVEGGSVCYFKYDNKVIDTSRTDLGERLFLDELDDGALCFSEKGIEILACPLGGWKQLTAYQTVLSAGPLLLKNGREMPLINHSFNDKRYSRTGIGITDGGQVLIVTVDGHLPSSAGMKMDEFRELFRRLGCVDALNLDGGGSTLMWIKDQPHNGIVSRHLDKKLLKTFVERKVANALVLTLSGD